MPHLGQIYPEFDREIDFFLPQLPKMQLWVEMEVRVFRLMIRNTTGGNANPAPQPIVRINCTIR